MRLRVPRPPAARRHDGRSPARALGRSPLARRLMPARDRGEDGFILLESLVAISLITILMGALASMTLNVVSGTSELRARQGATQLATSTMATLGSVPATDLLSGHDASSVASQWNAASATVAPWLTAMTQAVDPNPNVVAGSGATATIPTAPVTQTLNSVSYSVSTYLGTCAIRNATATDCVVSGTGISHLRAVVAVTWKGRGCRPASCTYVTATLVNTDPDPVFNTNRANPPAKPAVENPGDVVSTRGAPVNRQLTVTPGTGVAPLTWQVTTGTLPTGLTLTADGLVTGSPSVLVSKTPLTVTVSDAFGRTGTAGFTWSVVAPPTVTTPGAQSSVVGKALSLAVGFTCPNSPCTFAIAGAPAGLTIDAATGTISGTPTTAGTSSVTVTITDASAVSVSTSAFTWKVLSPPTIATPAALNATVGTTVSVPVAYTCPSGPCTLTLTGTPAGVGLSATTPVTANNTTTTLNVATGSGTVYLAGTVQTSAVASGTSQDYAPVVKVVDSASSTVTSGPGDWTMFTRPTVGAVGTRTITVGTTVDVPVAYTCPNAPCTVTLANTLPGLGLSATPGRTTTNTTTSLSLTATTGTFYVSGLVGSTAVPSGTTKAYAVTLTLTDAGTAAATSTGTWTATTAPKLTNPGSQAVEPNQNLSLQMTAACPTGGCTWAAAAQIAGDPTWYAIPISSTGRVTYNQTPAGTYQVRVTVTNPNGASDTTTFALAVQNFTLAIPNQTTTKPTSGTTVVTLDVSTLVRPLADGYTYQLTGQPSWLTIDANGLLTATVTPTSVTDTAITVTVTSSSSATSTVAATFSWTIR